ILALDVENANSFARHRDVGADLVVERRRFAGYGVDLEGDFNFAGSGWGIAHELDFVAGRLGELLSVRNDLFIIEKEMNAYVMAREPGRVDSPFDGQLSLDRHR